ncbi:MAG: DUF2344 domain-containing protein [Anaerolineae bacterium]|nr:DUF2344 domain-containing protein [Anaerolineae bacterium]
MEDRHRYEIRFGRGHAIRFISHLDLMRVWERMFRRARLPIAYSQGFNPRPLITFAAPLPVGVLSRGDLLEAALGGLVPEETVLQALRAQAVPGLEVEEVTAVPGRRRSLPARMREARYEIELEEATEGTVRGAIAALLAAPSIPVRTDRGDRVREYDLRPLVLELEYRGEPDPCLLARLRHDPQGTGRPDDLLRALGYDPAAARITRTELVLAPAEER